jgi:hypothetical protein
MIRARELEKSTETLQILQPKPIEILSVEF